MLSILEALPLTLFVYFLRRIHTQPSATWENAFLAAGLAATLIIALHLYKKLTLNRIFLGINLYLISGGLAFLTHQWWLNEIYGHFHASGMFLWIIGVGLVSTLASPLGFMGVPSPEPKQVRKFSICLLGFTICAFVVSYAFRGHWILSEMVPFLWLFLGHNLLRARVGK
ncbi:MAG: hypothetical protein MI747_12270 [Desulfobacterales bacterium]|nr:hypothetical protein [Desulfobacterales bacterium]